MRFADHSRGFRSEPVRAVTFDVTHTLIHSPRLAEIYGEVLRRHGLPASVVDLRRRIPLVWQELSCQATPARDRFTDHPGGPRGFWHRFLQRLCQHLELPPPSRFASAELFHRFALRQSWEVFPDVLPALGELRSRGLRLGVVSNWDTRLPELLDQLGLAGAFDEVTYSSACGVEKPHPRMFLACLRRLDVAPAQALHVGDSAIEDVEGALAVGMRSIRIDRKGEASDLWRLLRPLLGRPADGPAMAGKDGGRHARR